MVGHDDDDTKLGRSDVEGKSLKTEFASPQATPDLQGAGLQREGRESVNEATSNKKSAPALLDAAKVHCDQGRAGEAESLLLQALELEMEPAIAEALNLLGIIRLQREGPGGSARELFERALQANPHDPDTLINLGTVLWQQGNLKKAAHLFRTAVSYDDANARAHFNLGIIARQEGRLDEALIEYRRAVTLRPGFSEAHNNLGNLLRQLGRIDEAIESFRLAVVAAPQRPSNYANLANALAARGEMEEAVEACRHAVALQPDSAELHSNLGNLLMKEERLDEALAEFRRALKLRPDSALFYNNVGNVLQTQGKPEEALAVLAEALRREPDSADIHFNYGRVLYELKRFPEAYGHFERAEELRPGWAEAVIQRGNACYEQDHNEEALACYDRALQFQPQAAIRTHRALALQRLGRWHEALEDFDRAISVHPDDANTRVGRGMLLLKLGDLDAGGRDYEWRFDLQQWDYAPEVNWGFHPWDGSPFPGQRILVYHEQGLGDAIQMARYLPLVKARGGHVTVVCGPPLFRLFQRLSCIDAILSRREEQRVDCGYHVAMMSLPRVLGTRLETIPAEVPYLSTDPVLVDKWRARIRNPERFNVGLVWEGNPDQGDNKRRSCSLSDYAPLAKIPGVDFYSLQKGEAARQAANPPPGMELYDDTDELEDFAETAALIQNLDLVISVDTSVAHLAGALAHPVWTVLWLNPCFRYLLERQDMPWYPTMRLYRQERLYDWAPVIERVARDLADRVAAQRRE